MKIDVLYQWWQARPCRKENKAMKANPGGQIAIEDVVGRDQLIQTLWDTLEGTSVIMTAERRIGKTSIIRKMNAQPRG